MILVIDGTNWIHALWHANQDRVMDLAADRLNAIAQDLPARIASTQSFHVVTCWDRPSFRSELYPEYKAGREPKDASLIAALNEAPDVMSKDSISLAVDGFEADDLLASLAATATSSQQKCVICSGDKDLYQCLRSGWVSVLKNFKTDHGQVYGESWVTETTLLAERGLRPEQWIDYQCLVGESGDNVPGCPGWGPVNAQVSLKKCDSIKQMLAMLTQGTPEYNPWALPSGNGNKLPVRHRNLLEWREQYPLIRKLIELRTDVEVGDALK